jgi:hypothetical protein
MSVPSGTVRPIGRSAATIFHVARLRDSPSTSQRACRAPSTTPGASFGEVFASL